MEKESISRHITIGIVSGMVMVLLVAGIMLYFIVKFVNKQRNHREQLKQLRAEFEKQSLQSQLEIQEQTFAAISDEIHDNVGQILSLAKVQLNILGEELPDPPKLLNESKKNISRAMTDLRDIAKSLSTERMEQMKLVPAVTHEIDRLNRSRSCRFVLYIAGEEKPTDSRKKLIILRIIQECMNNVLKHAQATQVTTTLDYTGDIFSVTISDNGIGFDQAVTANQGLGLTNIIKRTALTGGEAKITSAPDRGTTIQLNIPYEPV